MELTSKDFERLTETQMEFAGEKDWVKQAARFEDTINWSHKYIYWVESYASALLATHYLYQIGFNFSIAFDEAMEQYCFTTDYAGSWVNA